MFSQRMNVMKNCVLYKLFLPLAAVFVFTGAILAQDTKQGEIQPTPTPVKDVRTTALAQLGLTKEQVQEIRRINVARKPLMDEAQKNLREANRLLDEAIYSDQVNETDVQLRLKDAQTAQAEVARIRFMNEFAVRRVLTPEQLVRFRELRQRFEQAREEIQTRQPLKNRMQDRVQPNNPRPLREVKQQIKADKAVPKQ